ncbi:MAG TPA: cytochrome c biogenesis protein CcdA [Pseudobdellovibrionaceae bacterium]|nr:cytochrome c biogenesis protein CcdA [Pseudobdellovibrionaceae bacterium]
MNYGRDYSRIVRASRVWTTTILMAIIAAGTALSPISQAQLFSQVAHASEDAAENSPPENPLTATAELTLKSESDRTGQLRIEMKLEPKHRAYVDKFKLVAIDPTDLKIGAFDIQPTVKFYDQFSKKDKIGVEGAGTLVTDLENLPRDAKRLKLKFTYQACTDEYCHFPKHIELSPRIRIGETKSSGEAKAESQSSEPVASANDDEFSKALSEGMFSAILFMLIAGFLTSLTPCIYPMIPITLAILGARTKGQSKVKSFALSFIYVLGIATTYSILGVIAALSGELFGSMLANVWVVSVLGLLFIAMGLSMYGLYEIQPPAFVRDKLGQGAGGKGIIASYLTGLAAGIVASPCVGPVLVSVLAHIATTQNVWLGLVLLFSFAMGMGVLFIVLGTSSNLISKVPKAGPWMEVVKFVFGTTMVAMAIYYVMPVYPDWLVHALSGLALVLISSAYGAFANAESGAQQVKKGAALAGFVVGVVLLTSAVLARSGVILVAGGGGGGGASQQIAKLNWQKYSDEALQAALNEKRPVIIDFWAEWCGACHELVEKTFTDPRVRDITQGFALFKIDATLADVPEVEALKKRYRVMGLPWLVFYDAQGVERKDLTLTGFEDADAFVERLHKASASK